MATNEEIILEVRETRSELRTELKELRQEMNAGFTAQNGRIRSNETRLAEQGVRIGSLEAARSGDPPAPLTPPPDFLTIFKAVMPWVLRLVVAGAVIAWGINGPALVEAIASAIGG